MGFYKVADVPLKVIGDGQYGAFKRTAQTVKNAIPNSGYNLVADQIFAKLSPHYALSSNPADYIFLSALAVREGVPNKNGDATTHTELMRFRPARKCLTFETFVHDPIQMNHFASEHTLAKGFIVDSILNTWDESFEFVETALAIDKSKDPVLAQGLLSGRINKFSMGSLVEALECSICHKIAYKEQDMCDHLKFHKMQKINGQLCFEYNIGVTYEELSIVDRPAEEAAMTRKILGDMPRTREILPLLAHEKQASFHLVASENKPTWAELMGIDTIALKVAAQYLEFNKGRIPASVFSVFSKTFEKVG